MAAEAATETPTLVTLYREAFRDFGTMALWNIRASDAPTPREALVVARALRIEGNLEARFLAERIEQVCRAAK
jgi:hypothetical protein